ncbi:hypothetical protein BJX62DRAFT_199355 [Aspergillus germanicus]
MVLYLMPYSHCMALSRHFFMVVTVLLGGGSLNSEVWLWKSDHISEFVAGQLRNLLLTNLVSHRPGGPRLSKPETNGWNSLVYLWRLVTGFI